MTATNFAVRTQPGLELPFLGGAQAGILCFFASSISGIRWCGFGAKPKPISRMRWRGRSKGLQCGLLLLQRVSKLQADRSVSAVRVFEHL